MSAPVYAPVAEMEVRAAIGRLPRFPLANLPTPLLPLPRASRALDGPPLYIKRDDLTGLAFGGNKTRKLEFFLGEAVRQGCNVLIAGGGRAQSNHARQAAAAARAAGMRPILVLQAGGHHEEPQGNQLLDLLLGAEIVFVPMDQVAGRESELLAEAMDRVAERERGLGNNPYVIYRSSLPLGTVGYVECALELARQIAELDLDVHEIWLASSLGTQAGLLVGAALLGLDWRITGVNPGTAVPSSEAIPRLAADTAKLLGFTAAGLTVRVRNEPASGPGYGHVTPEAREAIEFLARTEGIFLDPVYTGKAFAALLRRIRQRELDMTAPVVFLHTGGLPALFAYRDELLVSAPGGE